jgi:citrate synthase
MVGSTHANLYASISAGISALWGPLHGGANEAVIRTLEHIVADGGNVQKWVDRAKDPNDSFRLAGFGHRVYKSFDPRATIIKRAAERVLAATGADDELLDVARRLEEVALADEYFVSRKLYPNVDFYSGLIYRAIGFPKNMFTNCFAIGREGDEDRPSSAGVRRLRVPRLPSDRAALNDPNGHDRGRRDAHAGAGERGLRVGGVAGP